MREDPAADNALGKAIPAAWWSTVLSSLVLLGINSGFTVLKETPSFWHDAGGSPVALRELVLIAYYPLLGLDTLLCAAVGTLAVLECRQRGREAWWAVSVAALVWAVLMLNVGWLVANNVENLLAGRDLHYHPPVNW